MLAIMIAAFMYAVFKRIRKFIKKAKKIQKSNQRTYDEAVIAKEKNEAAYEKNKEMVDKQELVSLQLKERCIYLVEHHENIKQLLVSILQTAPPETLNGRECFHRIDNLNTSDRKELEVYFYNSFGMTIDEWKRRQQFVPTKSFSLN